MSSKVVSEASTQVGQVIPAADYSKIVRVVQQYYIDSLDKGNHQDKGEVSRVASDLDNNAIMYGYTMEGAVNGGPVSNLLTFVSEGDVVPLRRTRIDVVGISSSTAVVKVILEKDAAGVDYTDYHTLIKFDGEWCVIAKTFHAAPG